MIKSFQFFIFLHLILLGLMSCGQEPSDSDSLSETGQNSQQASLLNVFFHGMSSLEVEVFYEDESEPYTGTTALGKDYWNLFEVNLKEILKASERNSLSISIDTKLNEMTRFDKRTQTSWSARELNSLFSELGAKEANSNQGILSVIFISGHFRDNAGEVQEGVLGIHITGTTHIVIFKDVIKKIEASENTWVARFSEQSVLVHEVGHALGLVNNGLRMTTDHQDKEHGDHCNNQKCVMYWLNEGRDGLQQFIRDYISTGNEVIFDDQCLNDAHNH